MPATDMKIGLIGFGFVGSQVFRRLPERKPAPVVEMAHPRYTREWGEKILERAYFRKLIKQLVYQAITD